MSRFQPLRAIALVMLLGGTLRLCEATAGLPSDAHDLSTWEEVLLPPASAKVERMVWDYSANYSQLDWRVHIKEGRAHAQLTSEPFDSSAERPPFVPRAGNLQEVASVMRVEDGWLVGFNAGEFGRALQWFSPDGTRNERISEHQIVQIFKRNDRIHAIEGLSHMSLSRGSLIRIEKSTERGRH